LPELRVNSVRGNVSATARQRPFNKKEVKETASNMKETIIDQEEAMARLGRWQNEKRLVEVRLRFAQDVTQTHSGYLTVEPDGRVVVADVESRDRFLTTVFSAADFDLIKLIESENAITFSASRSASFVFRAITIACRQPQ
jgi:hypothetical protein